MALPSLGGEANFSKILFPGVATPSVNPGQRIM